VPVLCHAISTRACPNELRVADIAYLRYWQGLVFFAFVLDACCRS
jgi:hypothetical protein